LALHQHVVAVGDLALEQRERQLVLDLLLDQALGGAPISPERA